MKNTLADLNNYLFEMIERLMDDEIVGEELENTIKKSEQVNKVAKTIIEGGQLALNARKHMDDQGIGENIDIPVLGIREDRIEQENKMQKETIRALQSRVKKFEEYE